MSLSGPRPSLDSPGLAPDATGHVYPGDNPLYHPVSPVPAATLRGLAGDQALGVELGVTARRSAIAGRGDRAELRARARAGLPVLDGIEPAPLPHACALRGLIGRIDLLSLLGGKR